MIQVSRNNMKPFPGDKMINGSPINNRVILDPDLMLYLPLWMLDGVSVKSVDRNHHTCTITGGVLSSKGRIMDGDDYVTVPHCDVLNLEYSDPFTFILWAKTTTVNDFFFAKQQSGGDYKGYNLLTRSTDGVPRMFLVNDVSPTYCIDVCGSINVCDNVFHYIVVRYDGSGMAAGFDISVDLTTNTVTAVFDTLGGNSIQIPTENFVIGGRGTTGSLYGTIGDIIGYRRYLTNIEVEAIHYNTKARYL